MSDEHAPYPIMENALPHRIPEVDIGPDGVEFSGLSNWC